MNPPVRACHLSVHIPFDQRVFHRICCSLASAGFDTHLLTRLSENEAVIEGVHIHSIEELSSLRLGIQLRSRLKRLWRSERIAHRLKADVYHLHDIELIPVGLWLKVRTNAIVIYDSHEDNISYIYQKYYLPFLVKFLLIILIFILEWIAARTFDCIITADDGVADIYRFRYKARRVQVVRNFPRLDLFTAPSSEPEHQVEKRFDLVYHGTIPRYHLEVAFAIAEQLRVRKVNARWLFFGSCPDIEWAREELKRRGLAELFTIENRRIPHEEVAARVLQAKIGIIPLPNLPKFRRNVPTKLFEYMALGMPVVLSDLPASRPFVGDGECAIMVAPDDYNAYADAIIRLLHDPNLYYKMGHAGQQRVRELYNWDIEVQRLLSVYTDLLGKGS